MNPPIAPADLTELLQAANGGDQKALDRVTPLIYDDLRRLAKIHMRSEGDGHTLQTTGLVHEAFLSLVGEQSPLYQSRQHFFAVASTIMRRTLVSWARHKNAQKRGGGQASLPLLEELSPARWVDPSSVLAVNSCLDRLRDVSQQAVKVVECRYFAGLTVEETGEALGISPSTVKREWRTARAWLHRELSDGAAARA